MSVWSLADRAVVSTFETVFEFGGRRLALCEADRPVLVAGAWARHGVCAYDAATGERMWQRKALRQVQRVAPAGGGDLVAVCSENRAMHVLDAVSGATLAQLRGVRGFRQSRFAATAVAALAGRIALVDTASWQLLWRAPVDGFAILDTALAPDAVLVSDVTDDAAERAGRPSGVYAFDLGGELLWRWAIPPDTTCPAVDWNDDAGEWSGVLHHVNHDHEDTLVRWSRAGEVTALHPLRVFTEFALLPGARFLVTADPDVGGVVHDTRTGRDVWVFHPEPLTGRR